MSYVVLLYILFYLIVLAYCIISEVRSQDCVNSCENEAPTVDPSDPPDVIKEKISDGTQVLYETVYWRRAFIGALLIAGFVIILAILFGWKENWVNEGGTLMPRGIDVSIAILIIFLVVYFIYMFIEDNFWRPIGINIRNASELL